MAMIPMEQMQDTLSNNAKEFNIALIRLADELDRNVSQVIRKTILEVYNNITLRSPVDTGTYRASHGIAVGNVQPTGGVHIVTGGGASAESENKAVAMSFNWKPGDGAIWLFNNVPYAESLERGHSFQAPNGIYSVALAELTTKMNQDLGDIG